MRAQIVIMKSGNKHIVPCEKSYDKLTLDWNGGQQVWTKDLFVFPHMNVECILDGEMPEPTNPEPLVQS